MILDDFSRFEALFFVVKITEKIFVDVNFDFC